MQRGQLSYAKVRALTRVATPDNERSLLDLALAGDCAHVERFVRAAAQLAGNETILTRTNDASFALFNPFTERPVQGTNYQFGPLYGQPTGVGDYQTPREVNFSVGIRF